MYFRMKFLRFRKKNKKKTRKKTKQDYFNKKTIWKKNRNTNYITKSKVLTAFPQYNKHPYYGTYCNFLLFSIGEKRIVELWLTTNKLWFPVFHMGKFQSKPTIIKILNKSFFYILHFFAGALYCFQHIQYYMIFQKLEYNMQDRNINRFYQWNVLQEGCDSFICNLSKKLRIRCL